MVLQALSRAPFEPLDSTSLKYVTWKAVFLLAISSTARVSELQALDSSPDICKISRSHAWLSLDPTFLSRCSVVEFLNREID